MNNPRRKDYLEDVLRKALRANLGTIESAPKAIQLNYYCQILPHVVTLIRLESDEGITVHTDLNVPGEDEPVSTTDPFCAFDVKEMEAILDVAGVAYDKRPEETAPASISAEAARLWLSVQYPLTVTADRYGGTYSGGAFLAFPQEPHEVPVETSGEYGECAMFWESYQKPVGKGATPQEAVNRLSELLTNIAAQ